jgi:hypothetical protein
MKYFFSKTFIYFVLAGSMLVSCKDGTFNFSNASVKIDSEWGIALVNTEAVFKDFTIDSALSILADDNVVKIVYSVPLITSGTLKDLLPVYDYQWDFSLTNINETQTAPYSDTVIFSGEQDILFYGDTAQILIDTAVFNEGKFQLRLSNTINHEVKFRLKSKFFRFSDGRILDTLIRIPYNANNFYITLDLTGCRVKLRRNSLPCEIEIIAYNDGRPFLGSKKSLDVDVYGTLYVFNFLRGKVTSFSDTISAEQDFSINSDNISFNVQNINGVKIKFNSFNGFGAGVKVNIDTCNLITNGVTASLLSPANSTIVFEPSPTPYTAEEQSFTIPLKDGFSIAKNNMFRIAVSGIVNEQGMAGADVWVTDNSYFAIEPSLEIPLDFNLDHFIYRDTTVQEISKIEDIDFAEGLTVRIEMINDFPIELGSQLYFLDENYRVIDSLFSKSMLIRAATTNSSDGKTISSGKMTPSPLFIEINHARLDKIYNTKYISVYAKATSNNQQAIVRTDHKLKIKIGAKAKIKTSVR